MSLTRVMLALTATLMAVLMGVCVNFAVKFATQSHVPQHMILFFRFFGGIAIILPVLLYYGKKAYISHAWFLQGIRALMMTVSIALFFWTILMMPVGVAGAIQNLSPLFIPLGGLLILKEHAGFKLFVPVLIGLIGAFLATESSVPQGDMLILSVGILSAALGGMTAPLGKYLQRHDNLIVMVTWPAVGGMLLASIWCVFAGFKMPPFEVVLSLSVAGALGYLGWFLTQWAYQTLSSGAIAPIRYMAIPINLLGGMIFFGEVFSLTALLGITLIFISCVLPWVDFKRLRLELKMFQRWLPPK